MPSAPRPNNKAKKIAYKILGKKRIIVNKPKSTKNIR